MKDSDTPLSIRGVPGLTAKDKREIAKLRRQFKQAEKAGRSGRGMYVDSQGKQWAWSIDHA